MKFKKAVLCLTMLALICTSFAGCGKTSSVATEEEVNGVPKDPYEIQWYLNLSSQRDVASVEAALNEYLVPKINATVKLNIMSGDQYKQRLSTMMAAGQYFDLCWCASYMLDYIENAKNGAFYPLDDFVDTYLKGITSQMNPIMLESAKVNDKIYALPVWKEFSMSYGWIYRKDIADKYNIDMTKYKTFEELEPVLEMIKENEPDMQYPIDWDSSVTPLSAITCISPAAGIGIFNGGTSVDDVQLQPENAEYIKACETARRFYNKGLIKKDIMTATDLTQRAKEGKTFCMYYPLKPGKAQEMFPNSKYEWDQVYVTENYIDNNPGIKSMQAISATSKNPIRVAKFLNLLNTDPYVKNLVIYGVEGKHYNKVGENTVELIPNSEYNISNNSWMIGNVFIDYLKTDEDPLKLVKLKEFTDEAVSNIYTNFSFETTGFEQLVAAASTVKAEYAKQVSMGAIEPGPVLEAYAKKLRDAGAADLMEAVKKQYGAYLEEQK